MVTKWLAIYSFCVTIYAAIATIEWRSEVYCYNMAVRIIKIQHEICDMHHWSVPELNVPFERHRHRISLDEVTKE